MARRLLRRGVTSFLPTAVTAPLDELVAFAGRVRAWLPDAPADGAEPLGFNLEGPFLAPSRRGAHDPTHLLVPADVPRAALEPLVDGLRRDDDRAGAARRPRAHRLAARSRRGGLGRPLGRDPRAGARRLRGRRDLDDPPVQRDDRHRPSRAGRRGRGAARRRRLRRAHRRRACTSTRPSGRSSPGSSRRTACCSSATPSRWPGRATAGAGSAGSRSRSSAGGSPCVGHHDAGRLGHRPRQRGAEPGRCGDRAAGRRRGREPEPARPARCHRSRPASRSASGPISSSSTRRSRVRRVMRAGTWFGGEAD